MMTKRCLKIFAGSLGFLAIATAFTAATSQAASDESAHAQTLLVAGSIYSTQTPYKGTNYGSNYGSGTTNSYSNSNNSIYAPQVYDGGGNYRNNSGTGGTNYFGGNQGGCTQNCSHLYPKGGSNPK